ncbi:acyltransferase family protein [Dyella choica]|uniref:Acyltransferase n=1 Tax=Dyella choica TaxID=1927959 RepID=A0A432MBU1_9GAMM|nr:acyltransferase family protein [Dyella choica]RUL79788.1 acyltransferase [Dyella choica]
MRQGSFAYVPAIDGLRALAVLAVIVFHVDAWHILPGGFTGVDMFFVISGYVISQSLSGRGSLTFPAYLADFYRRRFLRILPALLIVLLASFLLSAMFVPQVWRSELNARTGLSAFFGLSNFTLAWNTDTYFSPAAGLNPYLHTWSLAVEEQFYLVFPALYFLWLRYKERAPLIWAVLPVLALASLGISVLKSNSEPLSAFYLLPSRFWELAVGAMLFQLIQTGRHWPRSAIGMRLMLALGLVLLAIGFVFANRQQFPMPWALSTVTGTLLLIAAIVQTTDAPPLLVRMLQSSPATYIGRLSYSLYLWHWPVAVFLRWTTGLEYLAIQLVYPILVFTLAAASYHWIETPIRDGRSAVQRHAWSTIAPGLAVICLFWLSARWISANSESLSLSQTRDAYTWYSRKYAVRKPAETIKDARLHDRRLFVIGDSHTAAYRAMLSIASQRLGVEVVEHEHGGCGVVTLIGPDPADCAEDQDAALREVEARAKPGDIVFLASLRMPELAGRDGSLDEDTMFEEARSELTPVQIEDARASAEAVLTRLEAAQVHILIDAPKPVLKAPPYRCSDWFNRMNPICKPGLMVERYRLEQLRAPQMALLKTLEHQHPDLHVWDPLPLLCPGTICSAFDHGKPLYLDDNHLSGYGNRVLAPSFMQAVLAIWTPPA